MIGCNRAISKTINNQHLVTLVKKHAPHVVLMQRWREKQLLFSVRASYCEKSFQWPKLSIKNVPSSSGAIDKTLRFVEGVVDYIVIANFLRAEHLKKRPRTKRQNKHTNYSDGSQQPQIHLTNY